MSLASFMDSPSNRLAAVRIFRTAPAEVSGRVQFLNRAQDIIHHADEQRD